MGHALNVLKNYILSGNSNCDGFPCFKRDWKEEYLQMLVTNTVSQVFYSSTEIQRDKAMEMHMFAADEDPEFMARALVFARNEGFMRLQPIIGLAVLSLASPRLFGTIFNEVVRIIPDLAEFTLVLESLGRGQGGRLIKKIASDRLLKLSEHDVIKYRGDGRGYSLRDLLRVYHPKADNETSDMIFKYIADNIDWESIPAESLPQIRAFNRLKTLDSAADAAEMVSIVEDYKLPYNAVTGAVDKMSADLWRALLRDMPLFALIRHLSVLERNGVISEDEPDSRIIARLTNPEAVRKAKILPFRFSQAWQQVRTGWLRTALETAVHLSVECLPEVKGRTAVLLDRSGSMDGQFLMAGGILALSVYHRANYNGVFIVFDTEAHMFDMGRGSSILSTAANIRCGGGTDTGAGIRLMTKKNIFADNIVIVTDEQQNTGSPFYSAIKQYRSWVNPGTKTFVVDVAPYYNAMVPADDENTYYCFGWSDQIVSFIARSTEGYGGLVSQVSRMELPKRS